MTINSSSEGLRENASKQSATQHDSLKVQRSQVAEISEDRGAGPTDQTQTKRLEWFNTWDEE